MVCGLRGPESPCWQTRDMTECIVHTLPGSGNTFCSTISSFCLCIIAFAPLSLLHSPWPPAFVMPPFPPSPPSSPCFGLAHFSDHRQWLNIPSCPLALAWQRQPVFLLLPLDYCAVIHPAFKHWPSSTCGFILIYHNIFSPFFPIWTFLLCYGLCCIFVLTKVLVFLSVSSQRVVTSYKIFGHLNASRNIYAEFTKMKLQLILTRAV